MYINFIKLFTFIGDLVILAHRPAVDLSLLSMSYPTIGDPPLLIGGVHISLMCSWSTSVASGLPGLPGTSNKDLVLINHTNLILYLIIFYQIDFWQLLVQLLLKARIILVNFQLEHGTRT